MNEMTMQNLTDDEMLEVSGAFWGAVGKGIVSGIASWSTQRALDAAAANPGSNFDLSRTTVMGDMY